MKNIQKKSKLNPLENPITPTSKPIDEKPSDEDSEFKDLVIIKTAQTAKLSPKADGQLTYAIGYIEESNELWLRIQANPTGGLFSNKWVSFNSIQKTLEELAKSKQPFSAIVFKSQFKSQSQNNTGFLAAILKAEGIIHSTEKIFKLIVDREALDVWQEKMLVVAQPFLTGNAKPKVLTIAIENTDEAMSEAEDNAATMLNHH